MPFQGNTFVRNQNFGRDRNAGPPDNTIQADRVDDEFNNVATGLTQARTAAATADDKAVTASAKATTEGNAARTAIRGGIEEAYDTLKKVFDWAKALTDTLRTDVNRSAPPGKFGLFFTTTAPAGWLHCNGAAVSRTTYAALFDEIGTRYGTGNGSTTFNLPDCCDEFFRGAGATAVGTKGAQSIQSHTHTASSSSAGSHNHGGNTGSNGAHTHTGNTNTTGSHQHGVRVSDGQGYSGETAAAGNSTSTATYSATPAAGDHAHTLNINGAPNHQHSIPSDGAHTHPVTVNATGSTETRPRFIALLPCIKT